MKQTQCSWQTNWKPCLSFTDLAVQMTLQFSGGGVGELTFTLIHTCTWPRTWGLCCKRSSRTQGIGNPVTMKRCHLAIIFSSDCSFCVFFQGPGPFTKQACCCPAIELYFLSILHIACFLAVWADYILSQSVVGVCTLFIVFLCCAETSVSFNHICPNGRSCIGFLIPDSQETCTKALTSCLKTTRGNSNEVSHHTVQKEMKANFWWGCGTSKS